MLLEATKPARPACAPVRRAGSTDHCREPCRTTYLALLLPGAHALIDVRVLRLLRIFRVFKVSAHVDEYRGLAHALLASRRKIVVFI